MCTAASAPTFATPGTRKATIVLDGQRQRSYCRFGSEYSKSNAFGKRSKKMW